MFIFEKLDVYHLAVDFYIDIRNIAFEKTEEGRIISRQILRSSLSISLNIAEGSGKNTNKDRKNFLFIARGSLYETLAIAVVLNKCKVLNEADYGVIYRKGERISKMLHGLIQKHS